MMNRGISSQKLKEYVASKGGPVLEEELLKLGAKFSIELHLKKLVREGLVHKKTLVGVKDGADITIYWVPGKEKKENTKKQQNETVLSDEQVAEEIEQLRWVEEKYHNEVGCHIERLHKYNETKDVAQELIGKIASLEGATVKSLYPRFELEEDD